MGGIKALVVVMEDSGSNDSYNVKGVPQGGK